MLHNEQKQFAFTIYKLNKTEQTQRGKNVTLMESKGNPCGKNVLDAPLLQKPFPYLSIRGVISKPAKDWTNIKPASECPWIKVSVCEILNL